MPVGFAAAGAFASVPGADADFAALTAGFGSSAGLAAPRAAERAAPISRVAPGEPPAPAARVAEPDALAAAPAEPAAAGWRPAERTAPFAAAGAFGVAASPDAAAPGPPDAAPLTPRERQILKLIAEGYTGRQIAALLSISPKTVENHRGHLMEKLDIHSIAELTKYAIREGITGLS